MQQIVSGVIYIVRFQLPYDQVDVLMAGAPQVQCLQFFLLFEILSACERAWFGRAMQVAL
jgi:hypothetical protein